MISQILQWVKNGTLLLMEVMENQCTTRIYGHLVKWIQAAGGCVAAFDFTTKGILQKLQFQE